MMLETFFSILVSFALCLSLVIAPAAADGELFHRASENMLTVYGNANLDNVIDENDTLYLRGIIEGENERTALADANADGQINEADAAQIRSIMRGDAEEVTVLDHAGRAVTVDMPLERIIPLGALNMRIVASVNATDKVIGIDKGTINSEVLVSRAHPELLELPDVTGNPEMMLKLEPDLIFMSSWIGGDAEKLQEKIQVPVVCIEPTLNGSSFYGPGGVFETWELLSFLLGSEEHTRGLIGYCEDEIHKLQKVTSNIPEEEKPRVYYSVHTVRAMTKYDPIQIAGGRNVAEELANPAPGRVVFEVPKEQIIDWNPDIIMVHAFSEPSPSIQELLSEPSFQSIKAVNDERVYYVKGPISGIDPASSLTECFYMAKLFHPQAFADLDVEAKGNEMLKRMYGADGLYTWMEDYYHLYSWNGSVSEDETLEEGGTLSRLSSITSNIF